MSPAVASAAAAAAAAAANLFVPSNLGQPRVMLLFQILRSRLMEAEEVGLQQPPRDSSV